MKLLMKLFERVQEKVEGTREPEEVDHQVVVHVFFVCSYVVSLRDPEGFLLDLEDMIET